MELVLHHFFEGEELVAMKYFSKICLSILCIGLICLGLNLNFNRVNATGDVVVNFNPKQRADFEINSGTYIAGLPYPIWRLETTPKNCWIKTSVSVTYEGNRTWENHYVRAWLEDKKRNTGIRQDTKRQIAKICSKGKDLGRYVANATAYGHLSDGTGYTFYGRDINNHEDDLNSKNIHNSEDNLNYKDINCPEDELI